MRRSTLITGQEAAVRICLPLSEPHRTTNLTRAACLGRLAEGRPRFWPAVGASQTAALTTLTIVLPFSVVTAQNRPEATGWTPTPAGQTQKRQSPASPPAVEDVPGLPRIPRIGDHGWGERNGVHSTGYTVAVREQLKGEADVHRVPDSGAHAGKGVKLLDRWLGEKPWAVIHFNFGLHDLKRGDHGQPQVPVEEYEQNLRRIVTRLQPTGATLVWASTTPIPAGVARRVPEDAMRYNAAARKVMDDNGVVVNSLYAAALPNLTGWLAPGSGHFTAEGASTVAKHAVAAIDAALTTRAQSQPP